MKIPVLSVEQMRKLDEFVINRDDAAITLMGRAGEALAKEFAPFDRIAIVCGPGNNGGDGFAAASFAPNKNIDIFMTKEPGSQESLHFFSKISRGARPLPSSLVDGNYDLIVDCLLGTGFQGMPRGNIKTAIEMINAARDAGANVISMDINSGVNGDCADGEVAVKSDLTLSIGYPKIGMLEPAFKKWAATIKNVNIGYGLTPQNLEPFKDGEVRFFDETELDIVLE